MVKIIDINHLTNVEHALAGLLATTEEGQIGSLSEGA